MNTILEYLQQTPWWVYLIFAYIIFVGVKGLSGREIRVKKLFILPVLFVVMDGSSIMASPLMMSVKLVSVVVGVIIGIGLGVAWAKHQQPTPVKGKRLTLKLRGSWVAMFAMLAIFILKYVEAVLQSIHSPYITEPVSGGVIMGFSAALTGLFIGRLVIYLLAFRNKD